MNALLKTIIAFAGISIAATTLAADLVGKPAPDFRLQDQNGEWHQLQDYQGRWVALYFYPKNDTPGCTTEACAFRDNIFEFDKLNAVVMGVSLDDVDSHAAFAEKYSLPFSLLADTEKMAAKAYNVLMKIGPMELAKRQSFLIDPNGTVVKHYAKVDPATHTQEVIADLQVRAGASGG